MSSISLRLPETFVDAKQAIEDLLETHKISIRSFNSLFSNVGDVSHYHIEETENIFGYANLDLQITYKTPWFDPEEQMSFLEKTRKLRVLTPAKDTKWTYRMIQQVWEGDYPSTVAYDVATGEVFFFNLKHKRIELVEFGQLDESQLETVQFDLNDREPFSIFLSADAMFNYIDGAEGLAYLRRNVHIEFNCSLPLFVHPKDETEAYI